MTRDDIERAARTGPATRTGVPVQPRSLQALPEAAPGERETRIPIKGVRKATAEAMVASAFTAPHVTEWVTVDVTRTMKLVERLRADREFAGVRVSPLLVVAKALILAVKRNPQVNATWDAAAGEIVVKGYVNLGIAAATPRGLVVPNVKDADRMSLRQLADALAELTATAREGRTPPPTWPVAPSRSRMSASSGSTRGRRSSIRVRPRSSRSGRCAGSPGCTRARSGRAG